MQQTQTHPQSVRNTLKKSIDLAYNIHDPQHPARELINKLLGTHTLTATVEEDMHSLSTMKHVEGLVAFVVTLTNKANQIVGQGRGSAILNPNAYISRSIYSAFNNAVVDAVIRATKVLNLIAEDSTGRVSTAVLCTKRQQDYLMELFRIPFNVKERDQFQSRLGTLTKDEASLLISNMLGNSNK